MQCEALKNRRNRDHSAYSTGTPRLRSGPSRSGHAASSPSLQALRKRPRIRGSPGANRDSHPQRGAVYHENEAAGSGPVGDRAGRQDHGGHRDATAGPRERLIGRARGRGVDARVGASVLTDERQQLATPPKPLRSGTSGLARRGARPTLADRRRAAVRRRRSFPCLGAALPRGCGRDRGSRAGGAAIRDRWLLLTAEPAGTSRHALSVSS